MRRVAFVWDGDPLDKCLAQFLMHHHEDPSTWLPRVGTTIRLSHRRPSGTGIEGMYEDVDTDCRVTDVDLELHINEASGDTALIHVIALEKL